MDTAGITGYLAPGISEILARRTADNPTAQVSPATANEVGATFADLLDGYMTDTVATDAVDKSANLGLRAGAEQDIHDIVTAATKAEITLTLTMQMRNKMIEAYQEISRMQI
jgi:flagellar hook-basal body complex protein FliE